jgi:hypothetical protein
MNTHRALGGLVALQLALAAFTWWPTPDGPPRTKIVPYALEDVTGLRIESTSTRSRGEDVVIEKRDGQWRLTEGFDFPAEEEKVLEVLEQLLPLTYRNPIATSAVRHEQLGVDDETPTRRVTITAGDQETTLLIGAASGKRMNVRYPGQDEVYQVDGMGAWAINDANGLYLEVQRVLLDRDELATVTLTRPDTDFTVTRDSTGAWTLVGMEEGQIADAARIEKFLAHTVGVKMHEPANPTLVQSEPLATFAWTLQDGTSGRYAVVGEGKEDMLVIEHDDTPPFLEASALLRQQLLETRREDLLGSEDDEASEDAALELAPEEGL